MQREDSTFAPTSNDLERCFRGKFGDLQGVGWGPRLRAKFDYFTPDEVYEATIDRLVGSETEWLDVGCGRFIFPGNEHLARAVADRCRHLVGVDPDPTLNENPFVHEKAPMSIDAYETERRFDLVTLRMVAEHIERPEEAVRNLARLTRVGGRIVIYTIFRWSPVPILTQVLPFGIHHPIKKLFWDTEEKDTFPVFNRMNTRGDLRKVFGSAGFRELHFAYLDDCRTTSAVRILQWIELSSWKALRLVGLHYPEVCLLGIYEKRSD